MASHIEESADVDETAAIGRESIVWHLAQVRDGAQIGKNCVIGRGAYIGPGVLIGDNSKIQNYALVYDPAELGTGVFIGPGVILTNDVYPRAIEPSGLGKSNSDWEAKGVEIDDGASIGARSVILAGTHIGKWALVGAGSVVIENVPDHALVVGNPSKQIGWVGRAGIQLTQEGSIWICPKPKEEYVELNNQMQLLG